MRERWRGAAAILLHGRGPSGLTWFGAPLEWPPRDLPCPTLWLVESKNAVGALDNFHAHQCSLRPMDFWCKILP